jgi:hypothetical protein
MLKVTREIAQKEVDGWLDYKKIRPSQREAHKEIIETLIEEVSEGTLEIDSTKFTITHNLLVPIGENDSLKKVEYRARLNDNLLEPFMKGVKPSDFISVGLAYIAALTNVNKGILSRMDSADMRIAKGIMVFFM